MSQRTPGLDTKYFTTHYELICYSTNNKEQVSQLHVVCVTVCPHIKISQIYLKGQRLFWLHFTTRTIWEPEAVFPPFWDTRSVGRSVKKLKANVFEGLNKSTEVCWMKIKFLQSYSTGAQVEKLSGKKILTLNGLYLLRCYGLQPVQYCACNPDLLLFEKGNCKTYRLECEKTKVKRSKRQTAGLHTDSAPLVFFHAC